MKLSLVPEASVEKLIDLYERFETKHKEYPQKFHSTSDTGNSELIRVVNEEIKDVLMPYYNKLFVNIEYFIANFLIKEPGNDSTVSAHQDWTFVDETKYQSINIWLGTEDINMQNGCMWFIPKSHIHFKTLRLSPHFPAFYGDYREKLNLFGKHIPTKKGEGFVFDHGIIHGSTSNSSNKKRIAVVLGAHSKGAELLHYYMPNFQSNKIEKYKMEIKDFLNLEKDKRPKKAPAEIGLSYDYKIVDFKSFKKAHSNLFIQIENKLLRRI